MKQAITRELFEYWDEIRGGRCAPERADIAPADIRGLLGNVFVLEVDEAGRFPFRLVGSSVSAIFLRELRGSSFLDLWCGAARAEIGDLLAAVLDDAVPAAVGAAAAPKGYRGIDLELLLLPLRHHGKTHTRLLGSLAPAASASWCGLVAVEPLAITSTRFLHPGEAPNRHRTSAAAPELPVAMQAMQITRHGHLTLYSRGL